MERKSLPDGDATRLWRRALQFTQAAAGERDREVAAQLMAAGRRFAERAAERRLAELLNTGPQA